MDSKLQKIVVESLTLAGLSAGIGFIAKKFLKTSFTNDPSNSIENYGKWVATLSLAIFAKNYLEKEKIIPA